LWSCVFENNALHLEKFHAHHVRERTWLEEVCLREYRVYVRFNVLCMLSSQFSLRQTYFFSVQALFAIMITRVGHLHFESGSLRFDFVLKKKKRKQGLRIYKATHSLNTIFHSHFSVLPFYLRYYLNNNNSPVVI